MKKRISAKSNSKLNIHQETIRRLSDLEMRAINGGVTSGHITCDSSFCDNTLGTFC
jgi:hypothetical protein